MLSLNLSKWYQSCLYVVGRRSDYMAFNPDEREPSVWCEGQGLVSVVAGESLLIYVP